MSLQKHGGLSPFIPDYYGHVTHVYGKRYGIVTDIYGLKLKPWASGILNGESVIRALLWRQWRRAGF